MFDDNGMHAIGCELMPDSVVNCARCYAGYNRHDTAQNERLTSASQWTSLLEKAAIGQQHQLVHVRVHAGCCLQSEPLPDTAIEQAGCDL